MNTKCKAKNPNRCPYHGKEELKRFHSDVAKFELRLTTARSYEERELLSRALEGCKAQIDAHDGGFKTLMKDLAKAQKAGDVDNTLAIAHRLQNAAIARLKDGVPKEWDESTKDHYVFTSKILEISETSDVVAVPYTLTGSDSILTVYSRLINEGYEVVDLKVHNDRYEDITDGEKAEILKRVKETEPELKHGFTKLTRQALKIGNSPGYVRGLSFVRDGRTVVVKERSTEEEYADKYAA